MPRSTKMFLEQSNVSVPPSVWLHVNGVSLTTDIHPYQPPVHSYDYRTKHLQSPVQPPTPPLISPAAIVPCSITMIDGLYINNNSLNNTNKSCQKLENTDMQKKFFIDRHIKKAKSLPGLIKGTALSRHTPLQSSTFTSPAPINSSVNPIQDDQLPMVTVDNDDDSLPIPPTEPPRRPRVYFADFNKIQFIDDHTEISQTPGSHKHHRHRRRLTKKTSNTNVINHHIAPSIQQTQILQNLSQPLSHQSNYQIAQELNIKKQQLLVSPRAHSSRITHLPDIPNQSLTNESSLNENTNGKYLLQREKHLNRSLKPTTEVPFASLTDPSYEDSHYSNNIHPSSIQDSHNLNHECDSNESSMRILVQGTSSISSTSINRQRPSLRTISLRQQFISPAKLKPTNTNPLNNSLLNTRRSISLKQSALRTNNDNNNHNDDLHSKNASLLPNENRPMTGTRSIKHLKRSDPIHFNSKNPFGTNSTNDPNKSHTLDQTQERFQNLLTIVRPPYGTTNGTSSNISSLVQNDSTIQTNNSTINFRSTRSTSARTPLTFHTTPNTIIV